MMVLQSHHLEPIETIFLTPLVRYGQRALTSVDLAIEFRSESLLLALAESAGVPKAGYGPAIASLAAYEDEIRRALDRLFTGF
ncbi:CcdB family protein [Phenylobacterium aquaticum]|uniref:CcdB family protein n=1 Tax=Phenylobacterium aquaticum TaxID=1763816 RepID=UPI0026F13C6F|nr:CcdB family protein [Phenylobacterium aquaticum]